MKKQRKPYRDITGKPLLAEDVANVCRAAIRNRTTSVMQISRATGLGIGRISRIMALLEKAGVVSAKQPEDNGRYVILRSEAMAINAALRMLRKGNK